jgi:hypothetical protein
LLQRAVDHFQDDERVMGLVLGASCEGRLLLTGPVVAP